jgi:sulfite exporter TauE/SafE
MSPLLTTAFAVTGASLMGSVHCAAMCGGLVSFATGTSAKPRVAQAIYHASRLLAYTSLGAIAGFAGYTLNQTFDLSGFQNVAGVVAGVSMIAWALARAVSQRKRQLPPSSEQVGQTVTLSARAPKPSRTSRWLAWIHRLPSSARSALMGVTSAVLPCGWLYTFVVAAAGQGNAWGGAAVMAAFWLGTVPMLLGVGGVVEFFRRHALRGLPHLGTAVLLILGLSTVFVRSPFTSPPNVNATDTATTHSCH